MNMQDTVISRMVKPLDAMRSFRGLTAIDTLKILLSLLIGYLTVPFYKLLKPAKTIIERRFGVTRTGFIAKIADLRYVVNRASDGFYFIIRTDDPSDYECTSSGYEPGVKKVFRPKQGEVVIDIGAHIGTYTVRAAKAVGKEGLVIALEPDPENFRLLNVNVKLNKLENVVTLCMGAYETDGVAIMFRSEYRSCHSLTRVPGGFIEETRVPTITLDTLLRRFNLSRIDWLKIDVEGGELLVLKGADKALELLKNLIIEVWDENVHEVFRLLKLKGFETRFLSRCEETMNVLAERCAS